MAINITGVTETGRYGEALTDLYARLEWTVCKCNTKILVELYYYPTKDIYKSGGMTAKSGDRYKIDYTGEDIEGIHDLIITYLVDNGLFNADQLTKIDIA